MKALLVKLALGAAVIAVLVLGFNACQAAGNRSNANYQHQQQEVQQVLR